MTIKMTGIQINLNILKNNNFMTWGIIFCAAVTFGTLILVGVFKKKDN